jgi:hypothetical protein
MPAEGSVRYRNGLLWSGGIRSASAFEVAAGRIAWIGNEDEARDRVGAARTVDLAGALVTPAFVDAHVHATATGLGLTGLDLRAAGSAADVLTAVAAAARAGGGRPILGGGWDETRWTDRQVPSAADLDRASYGGAVYLARVDVHSALASSALMAAVPQLRSAAGFDATGWQRGPAHDAVRVAALEALPAGQRTAAQRAALACAAQLGIACVHEMAGPVISSGDDLAGLLALSAQEPVPEVIGYWAELLGIDAARELGAVGAAGDLFVDGSLGSHTAALHAPYADRPETSGALRYETSDIAEHIARCAAAGLQAGFHAIGDAAVDQVLDAFAAAGRTLGRAIGPGHRIEHVEFVRDPGRLAAAGLVASMQPCFDALWGSSGGMYAARLGADRARQLNRFADLAGAGVPLAFGSDAPVTELGPWAAVRAAVHPHDETAGISVAAALAAHTTGGWQAAGRPGEGLLEPGRPATFAVWQAGVGPDALPELATGEELPHCLATVRAGMPIYDTGLLGDT